MLTRDGVDYLVKEVAKAAASTTPGLAATRVSSHVVTHSTAMHLLQSGVDISVIALWLGHESIETTHMYLQADLATKERALAKLAPVEGTFEIQARRFFAGVSQLDLIPIIRSCGVENDLGTNTYSRHSPERIL